jgi:hypothetical protein
LPIAVLSIARRSRSIKSLLILFCVCLPIYTDLKDKISRFVKYDQVK